jgi:uncharacterized protein with PQ loop repeat
MASILGFTAAAWGVIMALAPLLQVRRIIVRRSSADLSLGYFGVLLPGFALWLGYGLTRGDWPLIVPNAIALLVGGATVVAGVAMRRRDRSARQQLPPPPGASSPA